MPELHKHKASPNIPLAIPCEACPQINHRNYANALHEAHDAASRARRGDIILITGATGVGKSRLAEDLKDLLVGPPSSWPAGVVPLVHVAIDVDSRGVAMTKSMVIEINRQLGNPICMSPAELAGTAASSFSIRTRTTEGGMRDSFRYLVQARRTRYVIIDEIQHVNPKQRAAANARLESIKMLAGCSPDKPMPGSVVLILIGHYSLLELLTANRQLARRVTPVRMRVYDKGSLADMKQWDFILKALNARYPMGKNDLSDWNDVLYKMSLGNIGILVKILDDSNSGRRRLGQPAFDASHLRFGAPSKNVYEAYVKEMEEACEALAEGDWSSDIRLLARRGGGAPEEVLKTKVKRTGRIGKRKNGPRDRVGRSS
ncbi:ATP-binding protein [Pinirhizobacter soli]|uniref:ATP-binding protein n=1 Tax=Pinirhizobacter soli TaxID=2786953 RepID=UPI00202A84F5|nr:ATP-binding protein [Pinirhizobacter soli]